MQTNISRDIVRNTLSACNLESKKKKKKKKKIRIATEQNNTTVMAIASDELVAKEACYYASCYRMCIKPVYPRQLQNKIDSERTKN